ncbi:hypothetical protein Acsp03_17790 [Actinomadura sp. NBRC 104412]|nr:hypothetical protein Acsp03_17790 [Actinomadura sp. NBRC 104412]
MPARQDEPRKPRHVTKALPPFEPMHEASGRVDDTAYTVTPRTLAADMARDRAAES